MSQIHIAEIPIEIAPDQLSDTALSGVIDNFISREGTDYGVVEATYDEKVNQIRSQIKTGQIKIVYDQSTETVSLLLAHDFNKMMRAREHEAL